MIKNLLNVLRKTSFISWVTNDDVPTMYNIKIQDNDNFITIKGDVETEFDVVHNYKIKIKKNNLIKFNKSLDDVLTLICKNYNKELILSY
ncbi:hypothetical protein [Clostridium rectalis]|uniref:hypothetical protein n=1 Tax=Clostridium rectalis TaxID=2040295 RepID=UPI000F632C59|nr:hypothetical protein [Clostridium rectalis]